MDLYQSAVSIRLRVSWACAATCADASLRVNATTASQVFVSEVFNPLGLLGFTRLLLEHSARELGHALRLLIDRRNHPLLIHCTSGTPTEHR